jgi:hypothetical protein
MRILKKKFWIIMFDGVNLRDNVDMMTEIYSKVQIGPVLRQG